MRKHVGRSLRIVVGLLGLMMTALLGTSGAQTPIRNPHGVQWLCPDHAIDDGHEVMIATEAAPDVPVAILSVGDPAADSNGLVVALINVTPYAMGRYVFRVRALLGTLASEWSLPSEVWERVPFAPTDVKPRPNEE